MIRDSICKYRPKKLTQIGHRNVILQCSLLGSLSQQEMQAFLDLLTLPKREFPLD